MSSSPATAMVVDPSAKSVADRAREDAQSVLDLARGSTIASDADEAAAVELVLEIKARVSQIEETRKFFVDPLNKIIRTYNEFFRGPRDIWQECERVLKGKIAARVSEKDAANRAAIEAASRAETAEEARAIVAQVASTESPRGTSIRYRWVFEVVDADAVPRELCSPDPKKIAAAMAVGEGGQPAPIAGVVWKQEPIVTVRSK